MDGERGQATLEYVAVVGLVAVLVAVTAVAFDPGGVVNAVTGQIRRALCLVGGGACTEHRPKPCVVRADGARRKLSLTVAVMRLDDERLLLREKLSDGAVRLTVVRDAMGGAEFAFGVRGGVAGRRVDLAVGGQVSATLQAIYGEGDVFVVGSDAEADRLEDRLGRGLPLVIQKRVDAVTSLLGIDDDGPEPDQRFRYAGSRGRLLADLHGAGAGVADLEALVSNVVGVREDRRSGERIFFMRIESQGRALLGATLGGRIGALDAAAQSQAIGTLSLTVSRSGRPLALGLLATGRLGARGRLPAGNAGGARGTAGGRGARQWELQAEADLTDPQVRDAWAAWRRSPLSPGAVGALGAALNAAGRVDVREYRFSARQDTLGLKVSRGAGFGGEVEHARERLRLVSADTRPPGGVWERRVDCLDAA